MKDQMLLQGDLQKVFDALYHLGVIDPVLELDWSQEFDTIKSNPYPLVKILGVVNSSPGNYRDLMEQLRDFEQKDLGHLAIIVARELTFLQTDKVVH